MLSAHEPLLVKDFTQGHHLRPSACFLETLKATSDVLAPLRIVARPIGLIYADRGEGPHCVTGEDYEGLLLLFHQAVRGMNRLAGVR